MTVSKTTIKSIFYNFLVLPLQKVGHVQMQRLKERGMQEALLAVLSLAPTWGLGAWCPPHAQGGKGVAGEAPLCRDLAVGDPTGDLGKTFNLARPLNLQGQDTDPTGGGGQGQSVAGTELSFGLGRRAGASSSSVFVAAYSVLPYFHSTTKFNKYFLSPDGCKFQLMRTSSSPCQRGCQRPGAAS